MFALTRATCTLANFNTRTELHGKKREPAADLKITMTGPNSLLELFDSDLRAALFKAPEAPAPSNVEQLFETPPEIALTLLRFPKLAPVKWEHEIKGRDIVIAWGIDDTTEIELGLCDIDGFVATPIEGGSCEIGFRIACHPDEEDAGKLYGLQQQEITLTIKPAAQGSLIDEDADEEEGAAA